MRFLLSGLPLSGCRFSQLAENALDPDWRPLIALDEK
jgi:hypothetical protein